MFPSLQPLREKTGSLLQSQPPHSTPDNASQLAERTVLGSVSGTASSLAMLDMVPCRGGAADTSGAAISLDFRLSLRMLVNRFMVEELDSNVKRKQNTIKTTNAVLVSCGVRGVLTIPKVVELRFQQSGSDDNIEGNRCSSPNQVQRCWESQNRETT